VRAVEDALSYTPPPNAQLIRNLMIAAQYVHDHVMHFYLLHALDWVDVVSALNANPKETSELAQSLSHYPKSSPGYFADMQRKLKHFAQEGQLGIFAQGYWGHPAYKLPPEANLIAVSHYLEALAWQREVAKLHTILGGKNQDIITLMRDFVDQVYVPDTLAIAGFYKDWARQGEGLGNFMTYGDFPEMGRDDPSSFLVPSGVILNRDLNNIYDLDLNAADQIQEYVSRSWYNYSSGKDKGLHPYDGETELSYTGPTPPYKQLDTDKEYSWVKSPRWKGPDGSIHAVEVGPLARVLMLYANGHEQTQDMVDYTLKTLELPIDALFSTLGRTAARTLETKLIADAMPMWYDNLIANIKAGDTKTFNEERWEPSTWPKQAKGVGYMEAPRGALAHWIVIEDGKIANYQAVAPSTWHAGPRDANGQAGAYEAALKGHVLHDPKQPLEVLRTIHSFAPCLACAVH